METNDHIPILRRAGLVLLVIGLIDIGVMIYCITNKISYSSSFNVFAVVAGILLVRGSLRTVSIVRWYLAFMLSAFITLLFAWPFIQPFNLTITQIRLNPGMSFIGITVMLLIFWFLFWLSKELGRQPVLDAISKSGLQIRSIRVATALGISLVAIILIITLFTSGGETVERAKTIAKQQVGAGYSFYVSSQHYSSGPNGASFSCIVTAWNDHEVKSIPVHWNDR